MSNEALAHFLHQLFPQHKPSSSISGSSSCGFLEYFSGLKFCWIVQERYLYALVLLRREFVGADGSHGDVGSDQVLVLVEEREGVHPTEGRADHHHGEQVQALAHLLQETSRGQLADGRRRLSGSRLTQSCGRFIHRGTCERMQVWKDPINMKTTGYLLAPGCKSGKEADKNFRVIG